MEIELKSDSRKVKKGDTFIALKNIERDGHDFIENAIENGATKIICERGSYDVETMIVKDTIKYFNEYLFNNYYKYFKDITLIGITGTNGKTTTAYLTYDILNKMGKKTAYLGTLGFLCPDENIVLNNTTPDVDLLYTLMLKASEYKCKYMVMEVSSIALARDRIYGLSFDEVLFTNLTQDHLDFHKTMDNYLESKLNLFKKTRDKKIAIINKDDNYYKHFMLKENNNITFGTNADASISNVVLTNQKTTFNLNYKDNDYLIETNLIGKFNVYNLVSTILLLNGLSIKMNDILPYIDKLSHPPGRMHMIKYKTNSIFIDYAHTPDAILNVINNAKEFSKGKIITVFGCGGDRDKTKRPIMGDISTSLSDFTIFTDDNPRTEKSEEILNDITKNLTTDNYIVTSDREKAINYGINMLTENDTLLLLGKGHEDYQIIGKEKVHFSDLETAIKYIKTHK